MYSPIQERTAEIYIYIYIYRQCQSELSNLIGQLQVYYVTYEPVIMWSSLIGQLEVHIYISLLMHLSLENQFFNCYTYGGREAGQENCFASSEGSSGDTPPSTTTNIGTPSLLLCSA